MKKVFLFLLLVILTVIPGMTVYAGNHSPGTAIYLDYLRDEPFILAVLSRNESEKLNDVMGLENLPLFENNASGYFVIKIVQSDRLSSRTLILDRIEKEYAVIFQLPLRHDFKIAVQYMSGDFIVSDPIYVNEKSQQGNFINYADVLFDTESKKIRLLSSGYDSGIDNMPPIYSPDKRTLFLFIGIPLIVLVFTQIAIKTMQTQKAKKVFRKIHKDWEAKKKNARPPL